GPARVILAGIDCRHNELHAFHTIRKRWQKLFVGIALSANNRGELAVERRKSFKIPFWVASRDAHAHRAGGGSVNRPAPGQELFGLTEFGEPHVIRVVLAPFDAGLLAIYAQLQAVLTPYGN